MPDTQVTQLMDKLCENVTKLEELTRGRSDSATKVSGIEKTIGFLDPEKHAEIIAALRAEADASRSSDENGDNPRQAIVGVRRVLRNKGYLPRA